MEDKIEVEDYVRTDKGEIAKVAIAEILSIDEYRNIGFCNTESYVYGNIVKHSKQLVDLIEVGDFVNGYRVTDKYLFAGERLVLETEGNDTNCKCLCEKDIKTILTRERYMVNCYKVGGE